MYTFIRESSFKTMIDAVRGMPISLAIAEYYKKEHGVDVTLQRPVTGSPLRIRFISQMESMDAWRALQMKAVRDPAFQKLLAEIGPLVDGGKTFDEIWQ
jgi:hypothetical protein